ncbi:RimJ/RimL family protein N-acetyltransferase [Arthrobacter sp. UYCu712]
MALPAPISTDRLLLLPLTNGDAEAVLRFRGHPEATRYVSHEPLGSEENRVRLRQLLAAAESSCADWFNFGWAIELKATGQVIGDARTWNTAAPPAPGGIPADWASLGYIVHPDQHGRGLGRRRQAAWSGGCSPNMASKQLSPASMNPTFPHGGS